MGVQFSWSVGQTGPNNKQNNLSVVRAGHLKRPARPPVKPKCNQNCTTRTRFHQTETLLPPSNPLHSHSEIRNNLCVSHSGRAIPSYFQTSAAIVIE
eukprot:3434684-Amphidinium_carterae.1